MAGRRLLFETQLTDADLRSSFLVIPPGYVVAILYVRMNQRIVFWDSTGQHWNFIYIGVDQNGTRINCLNTQWHAFAQAKNLQVGDTLRFELEDVLVARRGEQGFKPVVRIRTHFVSIIRASPANSDGSEPSGGSERSELGESSEGSERSELGGSSEGSERSELGGSSEGSESSKGSGSSKGDESGKGDESNDGSESITKEAGESFPGEASSEHQGLQGDGSWRNAPSTSEDGQPERSSGDDSFLTPNGIFCEVRFEELEPIFLTACGIDGAGSLENGSLPRSGDVEARPGGSEWRRADLSLVIESPRSTEPPSPDAQSTHEGIFAGSDRESDADNRSRAGRSETGESSGAQNPPRAGGSASGESSSDNIPPTAEVSETGGLSGAADREVDRESADHEGSGSGGLGSTSIDVQEVAEGLIQPGDSIREVAGGSGGSESSTVGIPSISEGSESHESQGSHAARHAERSASGGLSSIGIHSVAESSGPEGTARDDVAVIVESAEAAESSHASSADMSLEIVEAAGSGRSSTVDDQEVADHKGRASGNEVLSSDGSQLVTGGVGHGGPLIHQLRSLSGILHPSDLKSSERGESHACSSSHIPQWEEGFEPKEPSSRCYGISKVAEGSGFGGSSGAGTVLLVEDLDGEDLLDSIYDSNVDDQERLREEIFGSGRPSGIDHDGEDLLDSIYESNVDDQERLCEEIFGSGRPSGIDHDGEDLLDSIYESNVDDQERLCEEIFRSGRDSGRPSGIDHDDSLSPELPEGSSSAHHGDPLWSDGHSEGSFGSDHRTPQSGALGQFHWSEGSSISESSESSFKRSFTDFLIAEGYLQPTIDIPLAPGSASPADLLSLTIPLAPDGSEVEGPPPASDVGQSFEGEPSSASARSETTTSAILGLPSEGREAEPRDFGFPVQGQQTSVVISESEVQRLRLEQAPPQALEAETRDPNVQQHQTSVAGEGPDVTQPPGGNLLSQDGAADSSDVHLQLQEQGAIVVGQEGSQAGGSISDSTVAEPRAIELQLQAAGRGAEEDPSVSASAMDVVPAVTVEATREATLAPNVFVSEGSVRYGSLSTADGAAEGPSRPEKGLPQGEGEQIRDPEQEALENTTEGLAVLGIEMETESERETVPEA